MDDGWISPDQVFDGTAIRSGLGLRISDGQVTDLAPPPPEAARVKGLVTPGFVDLQVNGGGGVLLNTDPTPDGMAKIAAAHRQFGTTGLLPTVITDAPDVLDRAVGAALATKGRPGILGLHIEGPHIAECRRGTHNADYIRPFSPPTLDHVRRLRQADIPVMITLAPEAAGPEDIAALAATGAVVSIGHSDTTADGARSAFDAGVTCATHLFNAMSPMLSRLPGVPGAVLNSDIHAGIIVDGIHVADEMVALAIRARPVPGRMFLVSDAMPTVGGPETFDLTGQTIQLDQGKLINEDGNLAGAHQTQAWGVERLVRKLHIDGAEALGMAITVPAQLMGLDHLAEPVGQMAKDLLVLDTDLTMVGFLSEVPFSTKA